MNGDLQDYQKLFDAIDAMVFIITNTGNILACNRAVTTKLGYSKEELVGQPVLTVHPLDSGEEICRVLAMLSTCDETVCSLPLIDKLGRRLETETRIYKGSWEGQPVLFGFSSDVTKQKTFERKFEAVFYYSPMPILVSRIEDGTVLDVNNAWCNLLGYNRSDVVGKSTIDLHVWNNTNDRVKIVNKLKFDETVSNEPVELLSSDGNIIYGRLSASQLVIDGEHLWVTTLVDKTEQTLLRNQLSTMREISLASAMEELDKQLSKNKYVRHIDGV